MKGKTVLLVLSLTGKFDLKSIFADRQSCTVFRPPAIHCLPFAQTVLSCLSLAQGCTIDPE